MQKAEQIKMGGVGGMPDLPELSPVLQDAPASHHPSHPPAPWMPVALWLCL